MPYTVYRLSHKDHGNYVGVTKRSLRERKSEILRRTRNLQCKIQKAVADSGGKGWTISALEKGIKAPDLGTARRLERKWKKVINPNLNDPAPRRRAKARAAGFVPTPCHQK